MVEREKDRRSDGSNARTRDLVDAPFLQKSTFINPRYGHKSTLTLPLISTKFKLSGSYSQSIVSIFIQKLQHHDGTITIESIPLGHPIHVVVGLLYVICLRCVIDVSEMCLICVLWTVPSRHVPTQRR